VTDVCEDCGTATLARGGHPSIEMRVEDEWVVTEVQVSLCRDCLEKHLAALGRRDVFEKVTEGADGDA
jgi:hypothetical protein